MTPGHADVEAAAGIFPGRRVVRLDRPVSPIPLTANREIHVGLNGNPVRALCENSRRGQVDHKIGVVRSGEGLVRRAVNQSPRQTAGILIDEHVEGIGWTSSIGVRAQHVHFGDIPSLPSGHNEVVGGEVVIDVEFRFEVLGRSGVRAGIVVLIIENDAGCLWVRGNRK